MEETLQYIDVQFVQAVKKNSGRNYGIDSDGEESIVFKAANCTKENFMDKLHESHEKSSELFKKD